MMKARDAKRKAIADGKLEDPADRVLAPSNLLPLGILAGTLFVPVFFLGAVLVSSPNLPFAFLDRFYPPAVAKAQMQKEKAAAAEKKAKEAAAKEAAAKKAAEAKAKAEEAAAAAAAAAKK